MVKLHLLGPADLAAARVTLLYVVGLAMVWAATSIGRIGLESLAFATLAESAWGLVSRVSPVQTAVRNCTRDEGGPFGFGDQELIPSHRKLLRSKAVVVSVAEKSGQ